MKKIASTIISIFIINSCLGNFINITSIPQWNAYMASYDNTILVSDTLYISNIEIVIAKQKTITNNGNLIVSGIHGVTSLSNEGTIINNSTISIQSNSSCFNDGKILNYGNFTVVDSYMDNNGNMSNRGDFYKMGISIFHNYGQLDNAQNITIGGSIFFAVFRNNETINNTGKITVVGNSIFQTPGTLNTCSKVIGPFVFGSQNLGKIPFGTICNAGELEKKEGIITRTNDCNSCMVVKPEEKSK